MELKEYKNTSYKYTEKASEIARQMMLAGIGIIWIIRTDNSGLSLSDSELKWPLAIMAITLLVDFSQYLLGGAIWIRFYRNHESKGVEGTADVKNDKPWRSEVLYWFYYIKFLLTIIAYGLIIKVLFAYY